MIDLSIIIPSIRPEKWKEIYDSVESSVVPYSYEVIFIGPYAKEIPNLPDIKTIVDYGCPSRCVQIASIVAAGRYMTWGSDDGTYQPGALGECITLLDEHITIPSYDELTITPYANLNDEVIVKYVEGLNNDPTLFEDGDKNPHYRGPHPEAKLGYWHYHFHDATRFDSFPIDMRTAPLGMLSTKLFKTLGGFDCRMQHINMTCHDLSIRLQKYDGKLLVSPNFVLKCDFDPNNNKVWGAHHEVDFPLFKSLYETPEVAINRQIRIDFNNWMDAEPFWARRWEVKKL